MNEELSFEDDDSESYRDELARRAHHDGTVTPHPYAYYGSYGHAPHPTPIASPGPSATASPAGSAGPSTPNDTVGLAWLENTLRNPRTSTFNDRPFHHHQALDDNFDVEENREGFFDMTVFEPIEKQGEQADVPSSDVSRRVTFSNTPFINTTMNATTSTLQENIPMDRDSNSAPVPNFGPSPFPTLHRSLLGRLNNVLFTFSSRLPTCLTQAFSNFAQTLPPHVRHRIHKAVLATFLASLFSLVHPVQQWVGSYAALAGVSLVYNHPARTVGAQVEAALIAMIGMLIGMIVSLAGLAASVAFNAQYLAMGNQKGRAILAAFLLSGSFCVTYLWAKYPRFNLAGIMAHFIMIFSLTINIDQTTFSPAPVFNVICPLFIGDIIALIVNILFWRESASQSLGRAVSETLSAIRSLLDLTTSAFLLDPGRLDLPDSVVEQAGASMRSAMAKVLVADREARFEISYGYIRPADFRDITLSIARLAQHLSSLALSLRNEKFLLEARRGSVQMDRSYMELLRRLQEAGVGEHTSCTTCSGCKASKAWSSALSKGRSDPMMVLPARGPATLADAREEMGRRHVHRSIEDIDHRSFLTSRSVPSTPTRSNTPTRSVLNTSSRSMPGTPARRNSEEEFRRRPPLLRREVSVDIPHRKSPQLKKEIYFGDKRLLIIYLNGVKDPLAELTLACETTLDAMKHELRKELDIDVSPTNSFLSTVRQFFCSLRKRSSPAPAPRSTPNYSAQISNAIDAFDEHERLHLCNMQDDTAFQGIDLGHREELFLVFYFMFSLREVARELQGLASRVMELKVRNGGAAGNRRRRMVYWPEIDLWEWLKSSNLFDDRGSNAPVTYDDEDEDEFATDEDNEDLKIVSRTILYARRWLWVTTRLVGSYETKFALKTALAITIMSSLAYFDATMDQFNSVRWQWASMSIFLVMNPAVGGTVWEGFLRVAGTIVGGAVGIAAWAIDGANPYSLAAVEIGMGYIFWYIFVATPYAKIGSIGMITTIVVSLTVYASPNQINGAVTLGWQRMLAIIVGVMLAFILNWCVWPFIARHQLRQHISTIVYNLGGLYADIIGIYLGFGELANAVDGEARLDAREKSLRAALLRCRELLALTHNEPRLKAPFPTQSWTNIVNSIENLLNMLAILRCTANQITPDVIKELEHDALLSYRRDMIAAILVYFHLLAGSLLSKVPLTPYFPSARIARIKMINRIRQYSYAMPLTGKAATEYGNLALYAYMSCTEEVIEELENLSSLVKHVTGQQKSRRAKATNSSE